MVYRLLARFRRDPRPSSLLLDRRGRRIGQRLLDPKVERVVESAIKRFYLTAERPRLVDVYRRTVLECRKAGLHPPSYKAIWKRVSQIDPRERALKREGAKAAHDKFRPVAKGPPTKLPLELVQIDHTLADVMVIDEIDRQPIGRPWLTLAIDVATRMVAGSHLSLDRPSSTSVALTIAHAVLPKASYLQRLGVDRLWPVHGIPRTIHLDNGLEFHSQALERGCREHGIELRYRPVRTPHFGGHIERLIGRLMGDIHLLPGTTFSSVADRGDYDSSAKAVVTLRELERWLALQITGIYHETVHRALGVTPAQAWRVGIQQEKDIREPLDPQKFYIDFLPCERRLVRRDGIQLFQIHYWDNALSPIAGRSKQPYLVRYDPRDLSRIFVKDLATGEYLSVPYRDLAKPPISLWEQQSAVRQMSRNKRLAITEDSIFSAIEEQRTLIESSKKATLKARRRTQQKQYDRENAAAGRGKRALPEVPANEREGPVKPYRVEVWDES